MPQKPLTLFTVCDKNPAELKVCCTILKSESVNAEHNAHCMSKEEKSSWFGRTGSCTDIFLLKDLSQSISWEAMSSAVFMTWREVS